MDEKLYLCTRDSSDHKSIELDLVKATSDEDAIKKLAEAEWNQYDGGDDDPSTLEEFIDFLVDVYDLQVHPIRLDLFKGNVMPIGSHKIPER